MDNPTSLHNDHYDEIVKLWIFGEKGVGKRALIQKFVGTDMRSVSKDKMKIALWNDWHPWEKYCIIDGKIVKIVLLVSNRMPSPDDHYVFHYRYKGDGYVFIYDVTNQESFEKCYQLIERIAPHIKIVPLTVMLLGNKCDMIRERKVSSHKSLSFPAGVIYMETSIHDHHGRKIEEVFKNFAQIIFRNETANEGEGNQASGNQLPSHKKRYALSLPGLKRREKKEKLTVSLHKSDPESDRAEAKENLKLGVMSKQLVPRSTESVEDLMRKVNELMVECEALKQKSHDAELMIEDLHKKLETTDLCKSDSLHTGPGCVENHSWNVDESEIKMTDNQIGVGGYATVKIALFRGLKVAAKQMHEVILTPYNQRLFVREMNIAATIRHPNLIQFIGATTEGSPIILTELMETTLRAILEDHTKPLSHRQRILICDDVAKALNYLHLTKPHAIIHRDVSSANVLLEEVGGNRWRAKLSDYGSVNFVQKVTTKAPGCVAYAAPESLTPTMQSPKMDVFSYGVLIIEVFSREFPESDFREEMIKSLRSDNECVALIPLIKLCINTNPLDRPDMVYILMKLREA